MRCSVFFRTVVSYRNSTSNHNLSSARSCDKLLYLIEILHQTTTRSSFSITRLLLYLIEILHQTTTIPPYPVERISCILSKFYIKPQHADVYLAYWDVVSYRNSTSNHNFLLDDFCAIAVVSYRNSTSNHNSCSSAAASAIVVSYRNSTSNHNVGSKIAEGNGVVSYRNSTSNHNSVASLSPVTSLYLIEILHQTTTRNRIFRPILSCILSKFYIKPQLSLPGLFCRNGCILSKFYIKPQLEIIHRLQPCRCILSKFYIKPQLRP